MADYTQAAQTAKSLIGLFTGDTAITFFTVSVTSGDVGTAHGISGTPDFVLLSSNATDEAAVKGLGWTANATTLTLTTQTATSAGTISVIAGNLS